MYSENVYLSLYKKTYNDKKYFLIHEIVFSLYEKCIMTTNIS